MNDINTLVKWIKDNCINDENRLANGEIDWNFVEADIELVACGLGDDPDTVRDPLPPLPFKPSYEEIDAAFEMIDEPASDILTYADRNG